MTKSDLDVYVGEIGIYQWRVFIVVFLFTIYCTDSIQIIFLGADMPHWCRVPELADLPHDVQKHVAIPAQSTGDGSSVAEYRSCEMYALNYSDYNRSQFYSWDRSSIVTNDTPIVQCSEWIYDQSQFISTIVSKFHLVCGWNFLVHFVSTVYMAGFLVGAVTSGAVSDRFGRKRTMLYYFALKIAGMIMSVFGTNYTVFVIGRFCMGCGHVGYHHPGFVLVMELVGRRYRSALGVTVQIAFAIGYMMQPAMAVFLRDEFSYQLAALAPNLVFPVLIILLIPESPRWLAVHGKYEEVAKLLNKICETNGRKMPEDFNPESLLEEPEITKIRDCSALLTSPRMRRRTLIMDFTWATCSLIYYALAFNTGSLHGNVYINTFLSGALEVPAYVVSILMVNRRPMGRRWTGCLGLMGSGIASFLCIPVIVHGYDMATVVFALLGKTLICITYSVLYVFANELFPTEVRNVGVGTASMSARLSSMAASYAGGPLALLWKPLPSLLFGVLAAVSGLLYIWLPETLGHILPDTIEEAEAFEHGRYQPRDVKARSAVELDKEATVSAEAAASACADTGTKQLDAGDVVVMTTSESKRKTTHS